MNDNEGKFKYGNDYGVPVAFRIPTDDAKFIQDLAKRRLEYPTDIYQQAIKEFIENKKRIESELND